MLKKALYVAGRTISGLMAIAAVAGLLIYGGNHGSASWAWELYGVLILAVAAGVVAHEFGHLLACLAVGAKVKAFRLGHDRAAIKFRVRTVQVSLGWPYRGRVEHGGASLGKRVVITLSGSLADLALAGLVLLSLAIAPYGQDGRALAVAVALGFGLTGLSNLMPFRTRSGRLSDGARLFELRSGVRAAEALQAQRTAWKLLHADRAQELLKLHAGLDIPARRTSVAQAVNLALVEFTVALLPGLPRQDASLAQRRVSLLARQHDLGRARPFADLALALLRLRLGGPGSYAEAERLGGQAMAVKDVPDSVRVVALATVVVAWQALGLSYEDARATATALSTTAMPAAAEPNLRETVASLKAALDPEGFLGAFRAEVADTRLGAGALAGMLRRQGRIAELLELHKGFGVPEGSQASAEARSVHKVDDNLLLMPGVPREVADEAASRMRWILANYPFEAEKGSPPRPAVEHTLALARLRQGKFEEVEPLCAAGLGGDHGPDARATILATIVLARRALGQPHADLLAEAVALSPDADLVAEAVQGTPAPSIALPAPPYQHRLTSIDLAVVIDGERVGRSAAAAASALTPPPAGTATSLREKLDTSYRL